MYQYVFVTKMLLIGDMFCFVLFCFGDMFVGLIQLTSLC